MATGARFAGSTVPPRAGVAARLEDDVRDLEVRTRRQNLGEVEKPPGRVRPHPFLDWARNERIFAQAVEEGSGANVEAGPA